MANRLTAQEVSLLALDTQHNPGHVGTVDIFGPGELNYQTLTALVRQRISFVPRYRMRIRAVPGGVAAPVWVEDDRFDLSYHVRRSGLPRPGTMEQLREFVGRVVARRLDHSRPLWEMYLVDGLADDRSVLITKSHQLLVDGVDHVDIGQVLLDDTAEVDQAAPQADWQPAPEPGEVDLLVSAALEGLVEPWKVPGNLRRGLTVALGAAVAAGEAVGGVGGAIGELAVNALRGTRPPSGSPLVGAVSEQRRVATAEISLAELQKLRVAHHCTINDVVLAVLTGALRDWLQARGDLPNRPQLLALTPMSVIDEDDQPSSLGSQVAPHLIGLPVGEPNALMRLHQVSFGTKAHKDSGRAVDARTITDIAGFAPTTLHALGVRVAAEVVRRQHDIVITNAPGPQRPLFCAGSPMLASYPIPPLDAGHLLSIGVTSYDGRVFIGLCGDRDQMADLDMLAQCIGEALEELEATIVEARATRQPTRKSTRPVAQAPATKTPAKKSAATTAAKKSATKKSATKKSATKKASAKQTPAKQAPAKQTPTRTPSASARRLANPTRSDS